jgi:hypothetical protein
MPPTSKVKFCARIGQPGRALVYPFSPLLPMGQKLHHLLYRPIAVPEALM